MAKYYWLRLQKDFFKRHDIRIIEAMPNGKDYILFYLKLLVESVSHNGELRFSETIPYNDEMLATVTGTNVDIVRSAMSIFTELGMMEIMDDQTIFMAEVQKMIGSASQDEHTRESTRKRVQACRERKKLEEQKRYSNVTCNGELEIEIDIDKDIEKESNTHTNTSLFIYPNLDELEEYMEKAHLDFDSEKFLSYYSAKGWKINGDPVEDWKALAQMWSYGDEKRR